MSAATVRQNPQCNRHRSAKALEYRTAKSTPEGLGNHGRELAFGQDARDACRQLFPSANLVRSNNIPRTVNVEPASRSLEVDIRHPSRSISDSMHHLAEVASSTSSTHGKSSK